MGIEEKMMKKKIGLSMLLLSVFLTACSSGRADTESAVEAATQNESDMKQVAVQETIMQNEPDSEQAAEQENITQNESDLEQVAQERALGFPVLLPGFDWIKNVEYSQPGEDSLRIDYYDESLGGDCILTAGRESILDLSDTAFDESEEETWMGDTASGQTVYIKVQHSADGKVMTASWEYMDYQFVLLANVSNDTADTNMVPKTARSVIGGLGL